MRSAYLAAVCATAMLFATSCAQLGSKSTATAATDRSTPIATEQSGQQREAAYYEQDEIVAAAADFFGITAAAAAQLVERAFRENGRPTGYIRGEEGSVAIGVGVRYG